MPSWLGKLQDRAGVPRPGNNAHQHGRAPSNEEIEQSRQDIQEFLQKDVDDLSRSERRELEAAVRTYTGTNIKLKDGLNDHEIDALARLSDAMSSKILENDIQSDFAFTTQVRDDVG
ncbi:MAG: hypothetical protein AAF204_03680, partial [Pseudomonadota bacterium]